MCGACGMIDGGPDWIDRVDNPDGVGHGAGLTRHAERYRRLHLVNLLLRESRVSATLSGPTVLLRGPTGASQVVDSLAHVWAAVEKIGLAPVDPLDEKVLTRLSGP
jgi:hypothetical protein